MRCDDDVQTCLLLDCQKATRECRVVTFRVNLGIHLQKLKLGMINHHLIKKYGVRPRRGAIFWRALSCLGVKVKHRKNFDAIQPWIQGICKRIPLPACS